MSSSFLVLAVMAAAAGCPQPSFQLNILEK